MGFADLLEHMQAHLQASGGQSHRQQYKRNCTIAEGCEGGENHIALM